MIIKLIQLGQEVPTEQQIKDVFHNFHITRLEIVPPKVYVEFDDLEMVEFAYANGTIPELGGVEFVAAAHDFVWESIVKETTHIEKHPVPKLDKITSM